MSWHTPWPWSQAWRALVRTPVAPGMYLTCDRTRAAISSAASAGSASCTASRTVAATAGVTVVSGVDSRNSSSRPEAARARTSSQGSATGGGSASDWPVSTVACARTSRLVCGSPISNTLTKVPQ